MQSNRPPAIEIDAPAFAERRERYFAAKGNGFDVKAADRAYEINLYDEIGPFGVSAKDFRAKLTEAGDRDITLRINSPGGHVFQGLAIYADLIAHPGKIRVEIVGVAASVASIIAMSGDERLISPESFLMIHNSWTLALGNESELTEIAALLRKIDDGMARTYSARTKIDARVIKRAMSDETWYVGKEAVESGFATGLLPASEARARFDLSIFAKAPVKLRDVVPGANTKPTDIRSFEALLRDAGGFSRSQAKTLAAGGFNAIADHRDDEAFQELAQHINAQANSISQSI